MPIATTIIDHPTKRVQTYHRHGYVFFAFRQFCRKELAIEDFFCVGDVTSPFNVVTYQQKNQPDISSGMLVLSRLMTGEFCDMIIIIDQLSRDRFAANHITDMKKLQILAKKWNVELMCG